MEKIWWRNNLDTIGKWGGVSFLFGVAVTAFVFGGNHPIRAFISETVIPVTQPIPTQLKLELNSVSQLNNLTAPLTNLINNAINGLRFNPNVNIGTGTPLSPIKSPSQAVDFSKFFSSSNVSSADVMSFLKEAAVTTINLTILVFSIASQVLKGVLSALK